VPVAGGRAFTGVIDINSCQSDHFREAVIRYVGNSS